MMLVPLMLVAEARMNRITSLSLICIENNSSSLTTRSSIRTKTNMKTNPREN